MWRQPRASARLHLRMRRDSTTEAHTDPTHNKSNCQACRNRLGFTVPDHLLEQLIKGNVVIFAGAGASTESRSIFPRTLYDEVHADLGLSAEDKPPFPGLMGLFCRRPDGRRILLEKIRARFEYVESFPELYRMATRFHRELATLFYVDTYVTTNWDSYFEAECGAIPFVTAEDFAFWEAKGRKVFKIHGSISSLGSVVATDDDYRRARARLERGSLGSALKLLLATKTVVYVGYSFSDHDFRSIQKYIAHELRQMAPAAYIVSLDQSDESRFRGLGLTPIFTDAAHFIEVLKTHLKGDAHLLSDQRFEDVRLALGRAVVEHGRLHERFRASTTPDIVYCASYQDGLIHALERISARSHTGQYSHSCDVRRQLHKYDEIRKDHLRRRSYYDVAYIEGYMNGLLYLLVGDAERAQLPFYFLYGVAQQPYTLKQYEQLLKKGPKHKAAAALARRIVGKLGARDEAHHAPFL